MWNYLCKPVLFGNGVVFSLFTCPLALIQTKTYNIFGMSKIPFSVDEMSHLLSVIHAQTSTFADVTVMAEMEKLSFFFFWHFLLLSTNLWGISAVGLSDMNLLVPGKQLVFTLSAASSPCLLCARRVWLLMPSHSIIHLYPLSELSLHL